ncbi:hypothetical protein LCGC14_0359640 [marine sediment metagenome]|uniref:Uncharacterized protein n=1 Tax=marine sediment metagenome TaxID=412755 RepID=A0A0F9TEA0_9ZZZZ|nr:hypothetical protein [Candidatus Aminicenantes bacterium]
MPVFVAIKDNFWHTLIKAGQKIEATEEQLDEACIREFYITHGEDVTEELKKVEVKKKEFKEADKLKLLLEEAGIVVDSRWGLKRLRNEVKKNKIKT